MDAIKRVVPLLSDTRHAPLVSQAQEILSLATEAAETKYAEESRAWLLKMYELDDESSGEGYMCGRISACTRFCLIFMSLFSFHGTDGCY